MEEQLGEHYIVELYDCRSGILDDLNRIESTLLQAAHIAGATVIDHRFHKFSPQGVSGVVLIAESHLSVHTWPENNYAAIDLFTCNIEMKMEAVFTLLQKDFAPDSMDVRRIQRGILDPNLRNILGEQNSKKALV